MGPEEPRTLRIDVQRGGEEKTTAAIKLADTLASDEQRVLIIDADPLGHAAGGSTCSPSIRSSSTHHPASRMRLASVIRGTTARRPAEDSARCADQCGRAAGWAGPAGPGRHRDHRRRPRRPVPVRPHDPERPADRP